MVQLYSLIHMNFFKYFRTVPNSPHHRYSTYYPQELKFWLFFPVTEMNPALRHKLPGSVLTGTNCQHPGT